MNDDTPPARSRAIQLLLVASVALFVLLGLGPHTGRIQLFTVLTASMDPTIPAGSVVLVTPVDPADIKVGDVITYRIPVQDRRVVTHRVVKVDDAGGRPLVHTKGDATEDVDQWTTRFADGPVWKVRFHVAGVGSGLRAVQSPTARKLVLWAGPLLLLALTLLDARKAPRGPVRIPSPI